MHPNKPPVEAEMTEDKVNQLHARLSAQRLGTLYSKMAVRPLHRLITTASAFQRLTGALPCANR